MLPFAATEEPKDQADDLLQNNPDLQVGQKTNISAFVTRQF